MSHHHHHRHHRRNQFTATKPVPNKRPVKRGRGPWFWASVVGVFLAEWQVGIFHH